jgi:Ca2+-binding RTX toxin-like protein
MSIFTAWAPVISNPNFRHTLTALADGRFLVLGESGGVVQLQLYSAEGTALGAAITVDANDSAQAVAGVAADGQILIAFHSAGVLKVRSYYPDLTPVGDAVEVAAGVGNQGDPAIQALPGGRFLLAWTDSTAEYGDGTSSGIRAVILRADGTAVGPSFQVNQATANLQAYPTITVLDDGSILIGWRDAASGTSLRTARLFDETGAPLGDAFNLAGANGGGPPGLATLAGGGFVAGWQESATAFAQIYDDQGAPVGAQIVLGPVTSFAFSQTLPTALVALPAGGFAAAWRGPGTAVFIQKFDGAGVAVGPPEQVPGAGDRELRLEVLADGRLALSFKEATSLTVIHILDERDGPMTLSGTAGADSYHGTGSGDHLLGAAGADALYGHGGDDRLDGGTGQDALTGGTGNDVYVVDSAGDAIVELAGEGSDRVETALLAYVLGAEIEGLTGTSTRAQTLTGNELDNQITGGTANDHLFGLGGVDRLMGGTGADTMEGGVGDDVYYVDNAGDVMVEAAGEGTDTVYSCCDYTLGAEVEKLLLQAGALNGTGNGSANTITGNSSANLLSGLAGADVLVGGTGNDQLLGGDDADSLDGGTGNDVLDGGAGADVMTGGSGNDTYVVDDAGDQIVETATGGTDTVQAYASFGLSAGLENLTLLGTDDIDGTGTTLNNLLTGNAGANHLQGLDGADTLVGGQGADELDGGAGNDILDGGEGADVLTGGDGYDSYLVDEAGDVIVETATGGLDKVQASASYTLGDHVEQLVLTGSADLDGTGNGLGNLLTGNGGVNLLSGLAGADTLLGGDGDDTLIGGTGADKMTGGTGADVFVLGADAVHLTGSGGVMDTDQVLDLSFAGGDRMDLSAIDADLSLAGDQAFTFVSAFSGQAGQATLTWVAASNTTLLRIDVDGDRKIDLQVKITGDATGGAVLVGGEPAGTGGWLL